MIDHILSTIATRARTRSAEMEAQAAARHTGVFHVPENFALKAEAKALSVFASQVERLIGMTDPVPVLPAEVSPVPTLPYKLVQPGVPMGAGISAETAPPHDVVGNGAGETPEAIVTASQIPGSAITPGT